MRCSISDVGITPSDICYTAQYHSCQARQEMLTGCISEITFETTSNLVQLNTFKNISCRYIVMLISEIVENTCNICDLSNSEYLKKQQVLRAVRYEDLSHTQMILLTYSVFCVFDIISKHAIGKKKNSSARKRKDLSQRSCRYTV